MGQPYGLPVGGARPRAIRLTQEPLADDRAHGPPRRRAQTGATQRRAQTGPTRHHTQTGPTRRRSQTGPHPVPRRRAPHSRSTRPACSGGRSAKPADTGGGWSRRRTLSAATSPKSVHLL